EDGIRDATVTGVQTCALPIWFVRNRRSRFRSHRASDERWRIRTSVRRHRSTGHRGLRDPGVTQWSAADLGGGGPIVATATLLTRSEERRVGKEGSCRWEG